MNQKPISLWILIAGLAFLSISALFGGGVLIIDPTGSIIQMPLSMLEGTPFHDYAIPGYILFIILGIFPIPTIYGLIHRPAWKIANWGNPFKNTHWAWSWSLAISLALIIWISVQIILIGYGSLIQLFYGLLGVALLILTFMPTVRRHLSIRFSA